MNSSGIKRGLATTAVTALAIAGLPLFASPASASATELTVGSVGPARDAGTIGALVTFSVPEGTAVPAEANFDFIKSDFSGVAGNQNNANQTVALVAGTVAAVAEGSETTGPAATTDEFTARITVDTASVGGTATFGAFIDTAAGATANGVDASELRTVVNITTVGAPASIAISPTLQSAPVGATSGKYTATLKDSNGNTTQLSGAETVAISKASGPVGGALTTTPAIGAASFAAGTFITGAETFTASGDTAGLYGIQLTGSGAGAPTGSASLDVNGTPAAGIAQGEVDVVTGADTRVGFNGANTAAVSVRPDQASVTINIKSPANAGKVVTLTSTSAAAPNAVTFGGKASSVSAPITLDAAGVGSVTIPVDAASIQDTDQFSITGSGVNINVTYAKVAVSSVKGDATTYISSYGGTVNPVFTVLDQYGNPVTGVFVTYELDGGANDTNTESARKQVDANGTVTFDIKDTKASATVNGTDTIRVKVYAGAFDAATLIPVNTTSKIAYTPTGTGADFLFTVDGQTPGGLAYNPVIQPLTDTKANNTAQAGNNDSIDESATLAITGGTPNAKVTVSVDNGGLVLKGAETDLSQGKASQTGDITTDTFKIVGTKTGTVNVTVESGGKTKTATVKVTSLSDSTVAGDQAWAPNTARNIAVSGPEAVVAGSVVDFTVVITDAFGNPVKGYLPANITTLLTGPALVKGNSGASNAAGEIVYKVELDQDAKNPITFQVTGTSAGTSNDFGAAADKLDTATPPTAGVGLTVSKNVASASATVTNTDDLEQAVAEAEADLAAAEADLAGAQGDLDVSNTELSVADANVDTFMAKKASLKKKLNKADTRKEKRALRKKLRRAKAALREAKDALTIALAKVDAAEGVVALAQAAVTAAEEALAQAEADLEAAQG